MQLAQQIKMRQSQSLVMTPQLQQAIKLLQMTNLELCQFLENQQSENPFLEIDTKLNNQENKIEEKSQGIKETTSVISDDIKNGNVVEVGSIQDPNFYARIFNQIDNVIFE